MDRSTIDRGLLVSKTIQSDRNASMPKLTEAAMRGDRTTLTELLSLSETDINQVDDESMSALHWASAYGETEIIKLLLKDPRTNPLVTNKRGGTPLHQATISGALHSVKELLLDERVRKAIDLQNLWGESALILSATRGDYLIAFELLYNGADRYLKDNWGKSALEVASDHGTNDILYLFSLTLGEKKTADIIRDYIPGSTRIAAPELKISTLKPQQKRVLSKMMEAPLNEEQALQWIRDDSIDINGADYMRWSAIHKLGAWEKPHVLRALLQHPAIDVTVRGMDGDTALHSSISNGAFQSAKVLIEDGRLACDESNDLGVTPLMLSAALGNVELFKMLLEHADVQKKTKEGKTAWHFAIENGHEEIASLLPIGEPILKKEVKNERPVKRLNPKLLAIQESLRNKEEEK